MSANKASIPSSLIDTLMALKQQQARGEITEAEFNFQKEQLFSETFANNQLVNQSQPNLTQTQPHHYTTSHPFQSARTQPNLRAQDQIVHPGNPFDESTNDTESFDETESEDDLNEYLQEEIRNSQYVSNEDKDLLHSDIRKHGELFSTYVGTLTLPPDAACAAASRKPQAMQINAPTAKEYANGIYSIFGQTL